MVRTDAGDKLVSACNGRILSKQVNSLNVSTDKILKGMHGNWQVDCSNSYLVQAPNPRGGMVVLPLEQVACVRPNSLVSITTLTRPTGNFAEQAVRVEFQPYGNETQATITIKLNIRFVAPWWPGGQEELNQKIVEGADDALTKMGIALVQEIESHKGQKMFLKIK